MFQSYSRLLAVPVVCCLILSGCTTAKRSNTARTAVEQLLISNAIDQSLDKVNFTPFGGHRVYLEEKYVNAVDKEYLIGSVRHRMLAAGTQLVDKAEDSDVTVELRSGGIGTDTSESFVGTPEIALPGMLTIPEVRLLTRTSQTGTAKIALVAYDTKSKQVLGQGGVALSQSDDNNWFVAGIGPFQNGSIKKEVTTSTTGSAATRRNSVPRQVAFDAPAKPSLFAPSKIQVTGGEQSTTK